MKKLILALVFVFFPIFSCTASDQFNLYLDVTLDTQEPVKVDFEFSGPGYPPNIVSVDVANGYGLTIVPLNISGTEPFRISAREIAGYEMNNVIFWSDNPLDLYAVFFNDAVFYPASGENFYCIVTYTKEISNKNPVLIIPGLLGTEIEKEGELLWANIGSMLLNQNDDFMDPLSFNENLFPVDSSVLKSDILFSKTIGPIKYDYYEGLLEEFVGQGYVENQDLFTFPYDWRYGVSGVMLAGETNVDLLGQKIENILQQTNAGAVDVVAHSMGGLLVKKYVMDNSASNNIGKAVFVGVPELGSPKAAKVLLQGDNFGVLGLNDQEIKKISQNMPAAYDLLPSSGYLNKNGSYIKTASAVSREQKDLDYEETKDFLASHSLNSQAVTNSENLHTQDFNKFIFQGTYSINGCKTATLSSISEITNMFGSVEYKNAKYAPGDGTVPLGSVNAQANQYYALVSDHGKMPSQDGIRQQIVNIISGSDLDIGSAYGQPLVTQDVSKCNLNGRAIEIYSPLDIDVIDQDGNQNSQIPNADFEVWGEHKFVFLPEDSGQSYNINLTGTGNGFFTLKSKKIENGAVSGTEIFSNLEVTENLLGEVALSEGGTLLLLDNDGNGSTEEAVEPLAVLEAGEADDILPPVSEAVLQGEQEKQGFFRGDVAIEITAEDENTGILEILYSLDGEDLQKISGSTAEFSVAGEGGHEIVFFASDKAGNNELGKTMEFVIDKTPPKTGISFGPAESE